ncbi:hypothetical protein CF319_g871 [Tilletia indica]|nr:hypothetical protein CF319_g871 [Tilletia indica]
MQLLQGKGIFKHTSMINGVLLYGPLNTGKTLLVASAAAKAKITCIVLKASDIHNRFYGQSEKKSSIDPALLRRLAVHIEVPLPIHAVRLDIIRRHLLDLKIVLKVEHDFKDSQLQFLAAKSEGLV